MNIQIIGNGAFGSFLREWMTSTGEFTIVDDAESVILAVPISAYEEVGKANALKHLINVCSVQKPSMDTLLTHTPRVTGFHPIFGRRTPKENRRAILTYRCNNKSEREFLAIMNAYIEVFDRESQAKPWTPESHDELMFKTHYRALMGAKMLKHFVDKAKDVPDQFIPQSFRLMREFVKTMEDMPAGTVESILANPFAKRPPEFKRELNAEPWPIAKESDAARPS